MVLDENSQSYEPRSDALYSFGDTVMEAFVCGRGPLGPLGFFGLWFGIMVSFCDTHGSDVSRHSKFSVTPTNAECRPKPFQSFMLYLAPLSEQLLRSAQRRGSKNSGGDVSR